MKKQLIIRFSLLALLAATIAGCKSPSPPPAPPSGNLVIATVVPLSGSLGDLIQVNGSGFSTNPSDNVISFGEATGVVSSASATRLEVRVPFDAETSKLSVEVKGLAAISPNIFTVKHSLPVFRGGGSNEMDNLSAEFARVSSTLTNAGSRSIIQHGHVWSHTQVNPLHNHILRQQTDLGSLNANQSANFKFTSYMKDLQPNMTYSVRPYVMTKGGGVTYGPSSRFSTPTRFQ